MKRLNALKRKQGITLIALVVTIVILLILSGVTINMLLGEKGIIRTAQEAKKTWEGAVANEQEEIQNLLNELNSIMNDDGGDSEEPTKGPNGKQLIETVTEIQIGNNLEAEDKYGNSVTIPKGFKVVTSEGTTVPEGIVIEDTNQNQFVWIPVGTVHKDSNPQNDVTIKLGRYTFDTSNGTPTMQQSAFAGDNPAPGKESQTYADEVTISSYYKELTTYRVGTVSSEIGIAENATAKNLAGFVQSVADNGGYYIARYEASYGSGYNSSGIYEERYANAKPLSKVSASNSTSSQIDYTPGKLWNYISELDASKVSQNMYANDSSVGVESDLTNSYAWDTAIVFIQSMKAENSNYANANRDTTGNTTLKNTGETGDKACNIYDMAANVQEWTTEYSTGELMEEARPCTGRGGLYYNSDGYTASRFYGHTATVYDNVGFRVALYIK